MLGVFVGPLGPHPLIPYLRPHIPRAACSPVRGRWQLPVLKWPVETAVPRARVLRGCDGGGRKDGFSLRGLQPPRPPEGPVFTGTSGHRGLPQECQLKSPFKSFFSRQGHRWSGAGPSGPGLACRSQWFAWGHSISTSYDFVIDFFPTIIQMTMRIDVRVQFPAGALCSLRPD